MTQTFETIVVLDFEATRQRGAPPAPQEVIEFPSVLGSLREQAVVDSFSSFARRRRASRGLQRGSALGRTTGASPAGDGGR